MSGQDRKELIRQYREAPRPAGVYRVLHRPSGRALIGASPDVRAMFNRIEAQLSFDSFPNRKLQSDWETDGKDAFEFEVLDLLPPADDPSTDIGDDLAVLLEMWLDKLSIQPELRY